MSMHTETGTDAGSCEANMKPTPKRMTDIAEIREFLLGGNARFTLLSASTGKRFTYKVSAAKDGKPYFVRLLDGPDNKTDYRTYLGCIWPATAKSPPTFTRTAKTAVGDDAGSMRAFRFFMGALVAGALPSMLEFWHLGYCARCAKDLTDPASIARGFGPKCAKIVGIL